MPPRRSSYLPAQGEAWEKARMRALVRDSFTCQHPGCGETRLRLLQVHHIQPRIQGGTHDLANLTTLCKQHHADRHPHLRRMLDAATPELDGYPWKEL
jgi:5-methylcytosine-specific restriction endonuclease McrA